MCKQTKQNKTTTKKTPKLSTIKLLGINIEDFEDRERLKSIIAKQTKSKICVTINTINKVKTKPINWEKYLQNIKHRTINIQNI